MAQTPNTDNLANKLDAIFNLLDWIVEFNDHHPLMSTQKAELGALIGNARLSSLRGSVSTERLDSYFYLLE